MLEYAQNFEQLAMRFSPPVLVIPALILVLAGLFIWLGGLGFSKILVAVLGAVTGGLCGLFLIGKNIASVFILAAAAALIAMMFKKVFITLLAATLAAIITFAVLNATNPAQSRPIHPPGHSAGTDKMSISSSLQAAMDFASNLPGTIKENGSSMPAYNWAIIAAVTVLFIAAGFWLWRLTSALCCATMGTACIFAGMILLLIFKGSYPITAVSSKAPFHLGVFAVMTAFGTAEQLLLCKTKTSKKQSPTQKQKADKKEPEKKHFDWRNS